MERVSAAAKRQHIDFHEVEEHQAAMHARLENWARWCRGRGAPAVNPLFRMAQATARSKGDYGALTITMVDTADAVKIAKVLHKLPEPNRRAVQWCYVKPITPLAAARSIGTSLPGLYQLLRDGRQMLMNLERSGEC